MDYTRPYSPVPPPCPSPQLKPQPLPTPPVYARRPSLTPSSSSREPLPLKLKIKQCAAASSESLVFSSLKDAIVAGSPSRRRFSEHACLRDASSSDYTLDRRPRTADVDRTFVSLQSPASPSFTRKHRRSDSITTHSSDLPFPSLSPISRSLARKRTRSPSGGPVNARPESPPPVPPLPPLANKREGRSSCFSRKLAPIRIPELGLGLDEKLRSPLSPLLSGTPFRRRENQSKVAGSEETSFLHMSPKRQEGGKRQPARSSLGDRERDQLACCVPIRPTHSLPDIKAAQRRGNHGPSFTSRIFRLGTQLVH